MANLGDLNKVWEIKALKKPGDEDARRTLDKIAKQVQPIMRRRKWRVKVLSEFCPSNPQLLGLNVGGGVEVKLRLRRHGRDWDFLPFEQVLDTMLHELCHNEIAPHNAQFYKLWDELRKECEELVAKGISGTGQGFDAPGRRVGGFTHQPPLSSLSKATLEAAEKRRRIGGLLPSGVRRVGGDSGIMRALTPVQAAAMAAERRMLDDLWCGSISQDIWEHPTSSEAGGSSKNPVMILPGDDPGLGDSSDLERRVNNSNVGDISGSSSSRLAKEEGDHGAIWECSMCTLFNQPLALICKVCGNQKPKVVSSKFKTWSCRFCTLENNIKLDKCSACEQWRYSHGPPVSHNGPNRGT